MNCSDAERLIGRYADGSSSLATGVRDELDSHLAACAGCRAALDEQRDVAAMLRGRPAVTPRPGLVARVSARIDRAEEKGWVGLANWRRWSAALVPLAAAFLFAAYLDIARATPAATSNGVAPTFDEWTIGDAPVLQPSATGEALLETFLTGAAPASGESNVR